jgi:hypothetical protein
MLSAPRPALRYGKTDIEYGGAERLAEISKDRAQL